MTKIFYCFIALLFNTTLCNIRAQDILINRDTVVNTTWNIPAGTILKFGSKGHVSGHGTIRGGIIDAALGQWIFDTTLTLYPEATYGKMFSAKWFGAGSYTIDGGNIAGRCIRLFDISQAGWYATNISNLFSESLGSIGSILTQVPTSISNCTFHFMYPSVIGKQTLFYTNNGKMIFNTCTFRYYGIKDPMKFMGNATYNNCFFSGDQIKN